MEHKSIRGMGDLSRRSGNRPASRRPIAALFLLASLVVVAGGGLIPHRHASASPALFNEQHVLENPVARGGDVPLVTASGARFIAVLVASTAPVDDSAPSSVFARHGQPRAPPSA